MTGDSIPKVPIADTDPADRTADLDQARGAEAEPSMAVDPTTLAGKSSEQANETVAAGVAGANPVAAASTVDPPQATPVVPHPWIGPYKLLQQIGEGGMGAVYLAEQEKPVRRRVALKIIRPGMSSEKVIARFEAERQALALMDHPSIARVLDAGTTDLGQPFFVMELVRGAPITQYCDANHLTPRERLELFIPVCQAIQHAHQKGIIHRDIKPSNVLVTFQDGRAIPKVIDFGVAKAIDQKLTERTLFTEFGAIVGTPEYMSPEQARMTGEDIDTRSDVYSLGVMLYELLTGTTPLERARLREAGFAEILRRIREEEPPKPSTRLSATEAIASIAAQRKSEPAKLARLIRGELDWIVMKTLEKDRTRRYDAASGLAQDVERYLANEPVEASPPSTWYRLGKFARRHRAALLTAGAFAGLLVAAAAASLWQAMRATRAETVAKASETQAQENLESARKEEANAKRSAEEARTVLGFFRDRVVAAARPEGQHGGLGKDVSLRSALEAAERSIAADFKHQPAIEAAVRHALGESLFYLGDFERSLRLHETALALRKTTLGPNHPDTVETMSNLAVTYANLGRFQEAVPLLEEALKHRKTTLGPDDPETLLSMDNLAAIYLRVDRLDDAVALNEEALKISHDKLGPDDPVTLGCMDCLAASYRLAGRTAQAVAVSEDVLKLMKQKLGLDHPETLQSMGTLALAYVEAGQVEKAILLDEQAIRLKNAQLGPDHPETLHTMTNLAYAYGEAGRATESIALYEQTISLMKQKLGSDHPTTLLSITSLALAYQNAGRLAEAVPMLEETAKTLKSKLGPTHLDAIWAMNHLAGAYLDAKRFADARAVLQRCLELREQKKPDDWRCSLTRSQLGAALAGEKKFAEAEPLLIEGYEGMKTRQAKITAPYQKDLSAAAARIAPFYDAWGKPEKAAEWRQRLGPGAKADVAKPRVGPNP